MIKFFLTACMSMVSILCHAHNANEAYFNIHNTTSGVIVEAKFPWAIRNALLTAHSELEGSVDEVLFKRAFFSYIQTHFILTNANKMPLTLLKVNKNQPNGHSHQTNYQLYICF